MTAAERQGQTSQEPPAMRAARAMIAAGYRPVPITPGKKKPIGTNWGLVHHHPEKWRDEAVGIGAILGDDGSGGGLVDLEVDDPDRAHETLARMFPDGVSGTACFLANAGMHYVFRYDRRLARYGQTIIKGEVDQKTGRVIGNRHYLGIELRIGTIDPAQPVQEQSLVPPSPRADGSPREWIAPDGEVLSPETIFAQAERFILPLPDCVFADLDRYAVAVVPDAEPDRPPTWDKEEVKAAILPHSLELVKEWGLRITGNRPTAQGFIECRAIDRTDSEPSCGFNPTTGVFTDRKTGRDLSLYQIGLALGAATDFNTLVNTLGRRFGVWPASHGRSFEGSEGFEGTPPENRPWGVPRIYEPTSAVAFPLEVLPASLADLCRQGAEAVQCPVDYFGSVAVALAGAAIGMSVNLCMKPGYYVAPNVYLSITGHPGSKKSPVLHRLARPFYDIDHDLREAYRIEKSRYEEDLRQYEIDRKKSLAGDRPTPPIKTELTMDDVTREKMAVSLSENPRGLVIIKDELTSWVNSLNAYKPGGKGDDKQFWLSVNTGMPVKVDRKGGNQDSIVVPRPCVTIVGGLTPDMLPVIRGEANDGWIDRILFCYPDDVEFDDWTEAVIDQGLLDDWQAAVRSLWGRPMLQDERGRPRPFFIDITPEAKPLWSDWVRAHRVEQKHPDFPASLRGPWSKVENFAGRIALILSQLHQAYDPDGGGAPRQVGPLDVWGASRLVEYLKAHFRRARNQLARRDASIPDDVHATLKWLKKSRRPSFSERDIKLNFMGRFGKDPLALEDALAWLIRRDCIRPVGSTEKKTGRPHSGIYTVNPALLIGEAGPSHDEPESP